ncbi:MAG: hypothetical protein HFJ11_04490 [Bacilli bacterium]|nr:hypothetical protein [Bacilli bacterium]
MNVIVANTQQNELSNLDIDIIKSISGVYEAAEIVEMFKSFFYSKMILDVTAIKHYNDLKTYELLIQGLDPEKIIFLLPEGSELCTSNFLSHLISIGIYNFTTNLNGIKFLLKKPNTLKDVEHIRKMAGMENSTETGASVATVTTKVESGTTVIGVRNVTEHAGATTFIYMLKKELAIVYGQDNVIAIEIDKNDFQLFNDKHMVSCKQSEIKNMFQKYSNATIILVDLNGNVEDAFCGEVLYLVEPSTLRLNKVVRRNRNCFSKLVGKKVILNQSLLLNNDVFDFESEAGIKVFYNLPPLDERKRNAIINDFLTKLGLFNKSVKNNSGNKIFGLFRR